MAYRLNEEQRRLVLNAVMYHWSQYPISNVRAKLRSAESYYNLANTKTEKEKEESKIDARLAHRYADMSVTLVREVVEAYGARYVSAFLAAPAIFKVESSPSADPNSTDELQFNTILTDQQKETRWGMHLMQALLDIAKYNSALVELAWDAKVNYTPTLDETRTGDLQNQRTLKQVKWKGNHIRRWDLFNSFFDISVKPTELHEKGEVVGTTSQYSMLQLKELLDTLRADDFELYTESETNPDFNIWTYLTNTQGIYPLGAVQGKRFDYESLEDITPAGREQVTPAKTNLNSDGSTNWGSLFNLDSDDPEYSKSKNISNKYTVTKVYLREIPSCYKKSKKIANEEDQIELWCYYIVNSSWIVASKQIKNYALGLPVVFSQADVNDLGINANCPAEVAVGQHRVLKQLQDNLLASLGRALRDKTISDPNYIKISKDAAGISDGNIELKETLGPKRSIDSVFRPIPFHGVDIAQLTSTINAVRLTGLQSASVNQAQVGQFIKGNRTLSEFQDIVGNSDDKIYLRMLMVELTLFEPLKKMLKYNIIQFQEEANLVSVETKTEITIKPEELYKARVEFALSDALRPSNFFISPNVQQQFLQFLGTAPGIFQEYKIPDLVAYILTQSRGLPLKQFKLSPEELAAQQAQLQAQTEETE